MGYDCVVIPGAAKMTIPAANILNQAFCGQALVSATGGAQKTICSKWLSSTSNFISQWLIAQLVECSLSVMKDLGSNLGADICSIHY